MLNKNSLVLGLVALGSLPSLGFALPVADTDFKGHKHGEKITHIDDRLLSVLPKDFDHTKHAITYFSCNTALKNNETLPEYCLQTLPDSVLHPKPPIANGTSPNTKRDYWVGPIHNPAYTTCSFQADAEYGLSIGIEGDGTYWDADWIQLVNYDNNNEVFIGFSLNDEQRWNSGWNSYWMQDLRAIEYITYKNGKTYTFANVRFRVQGRGETEKDMNNAPYCWHNEWATFWGRRTLYQCYLWCGNFLW